MICASSRGGDERRSSASGGQHHHNQRTAAAGASQQHHQHQHNHQQQQQHHQQQVKRTRKKGEEEKEEQIRRRKQKQTVGKRGKGGGKTAGKGQEDGPKEEVKKKEKAEAEEAKKKWEAWERKVSGGVVDVEETLRKSITRAEKFETLYDADPKPIATGMFTNIRRCRSKVSRKEYAAKFSQKNRYGTDCTAEIYHEVALLSIVAPCPRVVHLCDVFETPQEIILVLEYAPGGDLQSIIDENMVPFESDVVQFVRSLLEGLIYIHEKHIAHLDIKPQNLVMMGAFPDCNIKLCDFEISRVILQGESIREILGTPDYVAPEILHYEPISISADMWSLGVTTYVLLTGFSPFGGETDQETFCNISKAQLDFPDELFEDVSDNAKDFISRLLVRDPSSRPIASECLNHPWISHHTNRPLVPATQRFLSVSAAPSPAASCKDLTVLRKHLSKSREALFERVAGSNLRKALSRSRDRLCGSHLSLVTKSRDTLYDMPSTAARRRSRDELFTLLSRSHETLGLRDCMDKKPGSRAEMWPLPGLQGLMSGTKNVGLVTEDATLVTGDGQRTGEGTGEDSDSEGTVRDWKEEAWTTATSDSDPAKICDSDGESDKGRTTENEEAKFQNEKEEIVNEKCENHLESNDGHINMIIIEKKENESDKRLEISNDKDEMCAESNGMPSPEPEEPRYTVAQLISVFNRRWESQRQASGNHFSMTSEFLFGMERANPKNISFKGNSEAKSENNREEITNNNRGGSMDAEEPIRPASEFLRSGSLSSETSGYETPSDVSSMASWEEGSVKLPKPIQAENEEDTGNKGSSTSERRGSTQGILAHHTWGMKVCDGSYNRAMEKFGNTEQRGRVCKPVGEQSLEKSHRKCKSLVKPFL